MSDFLQLHFLTSYPPSNLNRDDSGRPKSAIFGGAPRLRISSQSLKRAWRVSPVFADILGDHVGKRTMAIGDEILLALRAKGIADDKALAAAKEVAVMFGELDKKKEKLAEDGDDFVKQSTMVFVSEEERAAALALAERIAAGEKPGKDETPLRHLPRAADIAMFGRMLASAPDYNVEAAVQVAHALTTNRVVIEDDYFTAVDDLKRRDQDSGAGHVGETEYGSGVFYLYVCIDRGLLLQNLGGDAKLAQAALDALIRAAATVAPRGKQASFASRAYAHFIRAEIGNAQPRSLASAFLKPVDGDVMGESVKKLRGLAESFDKAYGKCCDRFVEMDVAAEQGSLAEVTAFAAEGLRVREPA